MLVFKKRYDGGKNSRVTGYWGIELKKLFSIVLLKFEPSHRENYHSHAFNAHTFWIKGEVQEEMINPETNKSTFKKFKAFTYKYTPKANVHKIHCKKTAWALCFRGPWKDMWFEYKKKTGDKIWLTHGRKKMLITK